VRSDDVREMMGGVEKALMVDDDVRERRHTELSSRCLMVEVQANIMVYLEERGEGSEEQCDGLRTYPQQR
jgi:hypothetical protein